MSQGKVWKVLDPGPQPSSHQEALSDPRVGLAAASAGVPTYATPRWAMLHQVPLSHTQTPALWKTLYLIRSRAPQSPVRLPSRSFTRCSAMAFIYFLSLPHSKKIFYIQLNIHTQAQTPTETYRCGDIQSLVYSHTVPYHSHLICPAWLQQLLQHVSFLVNYSCEK